MSADGGLLSEFKNATQEQDEVTQGPVKNFPPFCCKPAQCANVNISGISDSHLKGLVRRAYVFFYLSWICPLLNAAAMGAKLSIEPRLPNATLDFILSLGYIIPYVFGHLGVWILWYSLAVSNGKKRVVFSYIFGFLLLAFEIIMCLGVPQTGAGGFGTIVTMFPAHHIVAGALGAASFVLWGVMVGFHIFLFVGWIRWRKGHIKPKTESHHEDHESHHEETFYQPPEIPSGPAKVEKSSSNPFDGATEKPSSNPFDSAPSSASGGNPFD